MTEHEVVGWHHQLNGQESEQALGVGDGQGSLVRKLVLDECHALHVKSLHLCLTVQY